MIRRGEVNSPLKVIVTRPFLNLEMILCVLAFLFCVTISRSHSVPSARILPNGALELILEDSPGLLSVHVSYSINGQTHTGQFDLTADDRWVHFNSVTKHSDSGPIEYSLTYYTEDGTFSLDGRISPQRTRSPISPPKQVRRGTVVFRDDFNGALDTNNWEYEVSMFGGYNGEIQVYTNDPQNIFTRDGKLFIKPTITANDPRFGGDFLHTGTMDLNQLFGMCTNSDNYGCHREGKYGILPPVMSGKLKSKPTVRFGRVEVRAKVPIGDWLWPAIWMLPKSSKYGQWPKSGEIDLMECRGNTYAGAGGQDHGIRQTGATLHWGTDYNHNRFGMTHGNKQQVNPWSDSFHTWILEWTRDHIQVMVDGQNIMWVQVPNEGFFNWGHLPGNNIWAGGEKIAPFDQPFYLILNVAVGGTSGYFPDSFTYNSPKPWKNNSPTEYQDFWDGRNNWLPSWKGDNVAMQVDYVEMTQY